MREHLAEVEPARRVDVLVRVARLRAAAHRVDPGRRHGQAERLGVERVRRRRRVARQRRRGELAAALRRVRLDDVLLLRRRGLRLLLVDVARAVQVVDRVGRGVARERLVRRLDLLLDLLRLDLRRERLAVRRDGGRARRPGRTRQARLERLLHRARRAARRDRQRAAGAQAGVGVERAVAARAGDGVRHGRRRDALALAVPLLQLLVVRRGRHGRASARRVVAVAARHDGRGGRLGGEPARRRQGRLERVEAARLEHVVLGVAHGLVVVGVDGRRGRREGLRAVRAVDRVERGVGRVHLRQHRVVDAGAGRVEAAGRVHRRRAGVDRALVGGRRRRRLRRRGRVLVLLLAVRLAVGRVHLRELHDEGRWWWWWWCCRSCRGRRRGGMALGRRLRERETESVVGLGEDGSGEEGERAHSDYRTRLIKRSLKGRATCRGRVEVRRVGSGASRGGQTAAGVCERGTVATTESVSAGTRRGEPPQCGAGRTKPKARRATKGARPGEGRSRRRRGRGTHSDVGRAQRPGCRVCWKYSTRCGCW